MFAASLRISAATIAVCSGLYSLAVLGFAQAVTPATANGRLRARVSARRPAPSVSAVTAATAELAAT